jgi:excisionase family DNA binding protein
VSLTQLPQGFATLTEETLMSSTAHIPIRSAAKRLGVHENTIRNWIDKGILHAIKLPTGTRRLALTEVEQLEREMFRAPTSFREMDMKAAPKPLPESGQHLLNGYPDL